MLAGPGQQYYEYDEEGKTKPPPITTEKIFRRINQPSCLMEAPSVIIVYY